MEEGQVTIEGETRILPEPFFVIATQNPAYQIGTFPLPESQLDRFLMRIELGYPDVLAERALLEGEDRREVLARLPVCLTPAQLHEAQGRVTGIHVAPPLLDYIQALLAFSRQSSRFRGGLSPRAGLGLLRAARAWALLHRRGHVLPEDVQTVLPAVVSHRLHPGEDSLAQSTSDLVGFLLAAVALPA
jgi:MoxR-like ATPase